VRTPAAASVLAVGLYGGARVGAERQQIMAAGFRKNGSLELKFNEDRTQVLATIYPPAEDGQAVTAGEILERLKQMGVTYGIRDKAILDAVHHAANARMPVANVIVAQGILPRDGDDARVVYRLPQDVLARPLPRRTDGSGLPDWLALESAKMVKADEELAIIIPAQPGTPGKTLTWPVQTISPKPGKPSTLSAGLNVRTTADGLRFYAAADGYACLQSDQLVVHALRLIHEDVTGGPHVFLNGAVFHGNLRQAQLKVGGVLAAKGNAVGCQIRAFGDVFVRYAENCTFIVSGNVYVMQGLKNCQVNTRKKIAALESASLLGGKLYATEGVEAVTLGAPDFTDTEVRVGVDYLLDIRSGEIQEELIQCEANIARISQALKPFATLAIHDTLTEEMRQLLQKLQEQKRSQEARLKDLHNERRSLSIGAKEKVAGTVTVARTVHPGVWIGIHTAAIQVEVPMEGVRFVEASGGKSVQAEPLQQAA